LLVLLCKFLLSLSYISVSLMMISHVYRFPVHASALLPILFLEHDKHGAHSSWLLLFSLLSNLREAGYPACVYIYIYIGVEPKQYTPIESLLLLFSYYYSRTMIINVYTYACAVFVWLRMAAAPAPPALKIASVQTASGQPSLDVACRSVCNSCCVSPSSLPRALTFRFSSSRGIDLFDLLSFFRYFKFLLFSAQGFLLQRHLLLSLVQLTSLVPSFQKRLFVNIINNYTSRPRSISTFFLV
jgi:hypothetical protein